MPAGAAPSSPRDHMGSWDGRAGQASEGRLDGDAGGVIRQGLAAGRVDELVISTAPVILGAGKRLFEGFDRDMDLEVAKVYSLPYATHVRYTGHDVAVAVLRSRPPGQNRFQTAQSPIEERADVTHTDPQLVHLPRRLRHRRAAVRRCAVRPCGRASARVDVRYPVLGRGWDRRS